MSSLAFSLITGGIVFGVSRYLHASVESSLVYGFASATVPFFLRSVDLAEKVLKIDELRAGLVKRRKEAKEQSQIVRPPTPAEVEEYGFSMIERKIWARSKYEIEGEMIMAQEFIGRASENRIANRRTNRKP